MNKVLNEWYRTRNKYAKVIVNKNTKDDYMFTTQTEERHFIPIETTKSKLEYTLSYMIGTSSFDLKTTDLAEISKRLESVLDVTNDNILYVNLVVTREDIK